jgi:hypothetical protein
MAAQLKLMSEARRNGRCGHRDATLILMPTAMGCAQARFAT